MGTQVTWQQYKPKLKRAKRETRTMRVTSHVIHLFLWLAVLSLLSPTSSLPATSNNLCGDCSGHGACFTYPSAVSVCRCTSGWGGQNCSEVVDGNAEAIACPANCSQHGLCNNGTCMCDFDWNGLACDVRVCDNHCNFPNGVCRDGECVCADGYVGESCETMLSCQKSCMFGKCNSLGVCVCDMFHTGVGCNVLRCVRDCSGHGQCVDGTCVCNHGYEGVDCSTHRSGKCSDLCQTPQGLCQDGTCICSKGFSGSDCTTRECGGHCSVHGQCSGNGSCVCDEGYYGWECHLRDLPAPAYGHEEYGAVVCASGYGPPQCLDLICPADCSGVGVCRGGLCECPVPYSGDYCQVERLDHGRIVKGVVLCDDGWEGSRCERHQCHGTCQHGNCSPEGVCVCNAGFEGDTCERIGCPLNCSGFGKCMGGGLCQCDEKHTGADCSRLRCANDCSGHGFCDLSGSCLCDDAWGGTDCSETRCGSRGTCWGSGTCFHGMCFCNSPWTGSDCTAYRLPSGHGILEPNATITWSLNDSSIPSTYPGPWRVACDDLWIPYHGEVVDVIDTSDSGYLADFCSLPLVTCDLTLGHLVNDSLLHGDTQKGIEILCPTTCSNTKNLESNSKVIGGGNCIPEGVSCPYPDFERCISCIDTAVYHIDSPVCPSAIHAGAVDVLQDSPEVGYVMLFVLGPQFGFLGGRGFQNITSVSNLLPANTSFGFSSPLPTVVTCSTQLPRLIALLAEGKEVQTNNLEMQITCPGGCDSGGVVYGDGVYAADSSVCRAALHDYSISDTYGGSVWVRVVDGLSQYAGSRGGGGVVSLPRDATDLAFEFEKFTEAANEATQPPRTECPSESSVLSIECDETGQSHQLIYLPIGCMFRGVCGGGCEDEAGEIWGYRSYTDVSHVCKAAVHAGAIPMQSGGAFVIQIIDGNRSFWSYRQNEILSRSRSFASVSRGFIVAPEPSNAGLDECINECSLHGMCETRSEGSRCSCDPGWSGDDCSLFRLPEPAYGYLVAAHVSLGVSDAAVVCDSGFAWPLCLDKACPTTCDNITGMCLDSGDCQCVPGYQGFDCQDRIVSNSSTSRGSGLGSDCSSEPGGCGAEMVFQDSPFVAQSFPEECVCNGHGHCDVPGICVCHEGWRGDHCDESPSYTVEPLSRARPDDEIHSPTPAPCSPPDCHGRGLCVPTNATTSECRCLPRYDRNTSCLFEACTMCGVATTACVQSPNPPDITCVCQFPFYGKYCTKFPTINAKWAFPMMGGFSPKGLAASGMVATKENLYDSTAKKYVSVATYYIAGGMSRVGSSLDVWQLRLVASGDNSKGFTRVGNHITRLQSYSESPLAPPTSVPITRDGHGVALIGRSLYISGGRTFRDVYERWDEQLAVYTPESVSRDNVFLDDVWVFNLDSQSWARQRPLSTQDSPFMNRARHTMVAIGTALIVFGGYSDARKPEYLIPRNSRGPNFDHVVFGDARSIDASDANAMWSRLPLGPQPRYGHAATRVGTSGMAVFGGRATDPSQPLIDLWILDLVKKSWKQVTPSNVPGSGLRVGHHLVTDQLGDLMLIGGIDANVTETTVGIWAMAPSATGEYATNSSWVQIVAEGPQPASRQMSIGTMLDGFCVVYGGISREGNVLRDLWVLDAELKQVVPIEPVSGGSVSDPAAVKAAQEGGYMPDPAERSLTL